MPLSLSRPFVGNRTIKLYGLAETTDEISLKDFK
jgi:hypothetical protein